MKRLILIVALLFAAAPAIAGERKRQENTLTKTTRMAIPVIGVVIGCVFIKNTYKQTSTIQPWQRSISIAGPVLITGLFASVGIKQVRKLLS
ncbi:hypothetical protein HN446_00765 [bacterium]|nr:hypothetical protein [bacterium]